MPKGCVRHMRVLLYLLWLFDMIKNQPQDVYGGDEIYDDVENRLNAAILLNESMNLW